MCDGVLAYFGYPQAHEDDAERTVRAGLGVVEAVRRLQMPEALQVRIGPATGLAVVGDLIASGAAQEQAVIGESPNLAARLQGLAEPEAKEGEDFPGAVAAVRRFGEAGTCSDDFRGSATAARATQAHVFEPIF
jgi:class 3 adenylate cyclase